MVIAPEILLLPMALGLLGFVEPCVIGGHMLFVETQKNRPAKNRAIAVMAFVLTRAIVTGVFGVLVAILGEVLVGVQSSVVLFFGVLYILIGVAFLFGYEKVVGKRITMAPRAWKLAQNPLFLGGAFGLNVPACAAPILVGLLGVAATSGSLVNAFAMMFVFGFFLSAPLLVLGFVPIFANRMDRLAGWFVRARYLIGVVFVFLGVWSLWFEVFSETANWAAP